MLPAIAAASFASDLILAVLFPLLVEAGHLGFQLLNAVQQLLDRPSHWVRHEVVI
jgi:hypothetical protein